MKKRLIMALIVFMLIPSGVGLAKSEKIKTEEEKAQVQLKLKNFRDSAFNAGMRCIVNQFDERSFRNQPLNWTDMMRECQRRFGLQKTITIQKKEEKQIKED